MDASDAREAMIDVARVEAFCGNGHLHRMCLPPLIIGRIWIWALLMPTVQPGCALVFASKFWPSCQCQAFRTLSESTMRIASVECCLILDKASIAENSSRMLPIHFLMIISSQRSVPPV